MWSCVLLTDASAGAPVTFGQVTVLPIRDPVALVDVLGELAEGFVLVAAPQALAGQLGTATTVAAGRWPELRIARFAADHSPLALLSTLALGLSTTEAPAIGVRLVEHLLQFSWSGAWTGSVARLTRPAPSMGQHFRSLLPGGGFLLRQHPAPAVLGRGQSDDVPAAAGLDRVLLMEEGAVPSAVAERMARQPGVVAVRQIEMPGRWESTYGTGRVGQIAMVSAEPARLLGHVTHGCLSCGSPLSSPFCPFCRVAGAAFARTARGTGGVA